MTVPQFIIGLEEHYSPYRPIRKKMVIQEIKRLPSEALETLFRLVVRAESSKSYGAKEPDPPDCNAIMNVWEDYNRRHFRGLGVPERKALPEMTTGEQEEATAYMRDTFEKLLKDLVSKKRVAPKSETEHRRR